MSILPSFASVTAFRALSEGNQLSRLRPPTAVRAAGGDVILNSDTARGEYACFLLAETSCLDLVAVYEVKNRACELIFPERWLSRVVAAAMLWLL